jgi:hypothetical protein
LINALIIFRFRRGINRASGEVASEKLADTTVLENWFVSGREVESGCASCRIKGGFRRWSPVNGRVERTIEPSHVRVFEPVKHDVKGKLK